MGWELGYIDYDELEDYTEGRCDALAESLQKGVSKQLMESFTIGQLSAEGLPEEMGGTKTADDALSYDEWLTTYWRDRALVEAYGIRTVSKAFGPWLSRIWRLWRAETEDRTRGIQPSRH